MTYTKLLLPSLAALGLSALSACMESDSGDPALSDRESFHLGDYSVSGDTIFMQTPADTFWDCWSDNPTMQIEGPETDTTRFEISGNRLIIFNEVDTSRSIASGEETWAVVRRHSYFARTGGGPGLEGRWRWDGNGFEVLSESPDRKERARMERYDSLLAIQLDYLTMELDFSRGEARGRISGDNAGLFLARWNGALAYDSLDRPDSAQYAVAVTRLHPDTVRLVGRETGETVTVYYVGPRKSRWYASDRDGRVPYSEEEYHRVCGIDGWYDEFLMENSRVDQVIKRSAKTIRRTPHRFPSAPFPFP